MTLEKDTESARHEPSLAADRQTLIAPCTNLSPTASLRWLAAGWRDLKRAPGIALGYGLLIWSLSALISLLAWRHGGWVLLLVLLTGFVFVAPLLAFALYAVSRQLAGGESPTPGRTLRAARLPFQNAMVYGLILLVIFLLWVRAGSMVHIFFPVDSDPDWPALMTFLGIGSTVGALFAGFTFAASAFSLPMLANRDVDVVTAVLSSIHAVLRNKVPCMIWAALILVLTVIALIPALLGLVVIMPWLGFATWHGYRETLDASHWPVLQLPHVENAA